jgi:hypothetical protein
MCSDGASPSLGLAEVKTKSVGRSNSWLNLRTTDVLADFPHIRDIQVDEVGDCLDPVHASGGRAPGRSRFSRKATRPNFACKHEGRYWPLQRTWTGRLPEATC